MKSPQYVASLDMGKVVVESEYKRWQHTALRCAGRENTPLINAHDPRPRLGCAVCGRVARFRLQRVERFFFAGPYLLRLLSCLTAAFTALLLLGEREGEGYGDMLGSITVDVKMKPVLDNGTRQQHACCGELTAQRRDSVVIGDDDAARTCAFVLSPDCFPSAGSEVWVHVWGTG